ncbi:ankyrin repeat and SOCS box protein 7 isoform X2 [Ahaetulla prasina]|uniref:ankyrin repeat and SOCS box protein 7 isoform X2 n=1 Tax=Ahaetulla prasina TaxID=499056 RepID=UPI0026470F08|nr:ankyrin repeat and SOCS box protein 7 isoform X2 [Ahaetulla prasina]
MLHHHCRRNPELQEELQIQAAVAAGDVHTVRKMLEQGYSPNGRDANGWTLLHFSAARGKERCVRVFLEHGADPTVKDLIGGFTALHYAAMHGRARIARLMLESDYRVDIINAKSNDGWTPLHVAAHYGRDSFVRLLLEFKAEVDPLSDKGTTPLQLAIIRERSSCVKILLDHNANIDIQNGFLLRYAVIKSNHTYCRMFLQRGADTNLGRLEDGQTPLHLSALRDDVLCAQMLYNYGADTNTRNYEGQTPLAVSISISGSSRPCLDFLQEVTSEALSGLKDTGEGLCSGRSSPTPARRSELLSLDSAPANLAVRKHIFFLFLQNLLISYSAPFCILYQGSLGTCKISVELKSASV